MKTIGLMMEGCASFFWDAFVALEANGITGDYAEFGCHHGASFQAAFHALDGLDANRHMWAFDSWPALPDDHPLDAHPGWVLGEGGAGGVENFHAACARNGVGATPTPPSRATTGTRCRNSAQTAVPPTSLSPTSTATCTRARSRCWSSWSRASSMG